MTNLVKKVQNTIFQHKLLERGDKIILAVSGGPDSMCLLDVFSRLRDKYSLSLIVAHVNYGLRGTESDKDEKLVQELAEKHKLRFASLHPETKNTSNLESRLRDIRYDFFEHVRKRNGYDLIAVAHNLDDQVETFFMRLIRGAGLQGLGAMRHKNGRIIRPLLDIEKEEIKKYLKENRLAFRIDKSNLTSKFFRNRIRNKLIPYLEKNFNPQIKKTVFRSLSSIKEDQSFLEEKASKRFKGINELRVNDLEKLHPALERRLILKMIEKKRAGLKDIESAHVEEILKIAKSTKGKRQTVVFKGLKMTRIGDRIRIETLK